MEPQQRLRCEGVIERIAQEEDLTVLGWRDYPRQLDAIGRIARASQPYNEQLFLKRAPGMTEDEFERKLYVVRRRVENEIAASDIPRPGFLLCAVAILPHTIVYKGLLLAPQIADFYHELSDPDTVSALCLVHQRFSTNTRFELATGTSVPLHLPQR